ncbi:MAG: PDZ domain-containing protein [Deltaproteobacteria bacterium]|nr:MAG: PDZ domain-containing protein [Deltaproteobacteria bacterium]
MSSGTTSEQDKRALYWLGERLIDYRHPVMVVVLIVTGLFAYWSFQLKLETSFGDLLPQSHPFVQTHNKYAGTFGGANNIQLMVESKEGDIFTVPTLTRIYKITEEMDRVYGVNHNQIDSIGHRTTRYLRAQSGGFLKAEPVMLSVPKTTEDATAIRRIVHNTESIYGILVSLDDHAALVRANFIEARLDHRRTFTEINERVIAPFEKGWIGALIKGTDPLHADQPAPAVVETLYRGTAAADAGLKQGDAIVSVEGKPVKDRVALAALIAKYNPGAAVTLGVKRAGGSDQVENVKLTIPEPDLQLYVAGEPRLYGWVYSYATDVFWIFTVTWCAEWILRWLYFHDWRGALRPSITGVIAAFWGLGFVHLIGFALDPLILVMPFLVSARAVSHAIQMHDRYYEEFERHNWDQRKAIVAAFAELFVPTFAGVITDALGVLVIILVPVVMLQKLAVVISWWISAITVSEMLLNPIVYYYLRAPDPEVVLARDRGWYKAAINRLTDYNLSAFGKRFTLAFWLILAVIGAFMMQGLIVGDPTSASPLVWSDSPYNVSHAHIQDKFGGVEPLIVVAEGKDRDAMKDPQALRTMVKFQRFLERDPAVGYSFSLGDILRSVNMVFHELEPKWGVIPNTARDVGQTFFVFFANLPPTETAKYVDPSYTTAHVTFFCRNHKGDNVARIIARCQEFIRDNPMEKANFRLAGGLIGVLAAANEALVRNDLLMNFLGFFTIYVIVLFSYRSWAAGLYLLAPLFISNILINAAMAYFGIGVNINTLPLVTVGVGFGIDYGLYILSRIIEEIRVNGDLDLSIREALVTSGKAVSFTAFCMVGGTALWAFSNIRFNAVMGGLLAVWMFVSFLASETLLPVMISFFRPGFILREAARAAQRPAVAATAAAVS